jgi:hypothetical protein
MTEGIWDPNLGVWRYDLAEGTVAANSLKTHTDTSASDGIRAKQKTVEAFMRLSGKSDAKITAAQVSHIQDVLMGLRPHHSDGIPSDTAAKSEASLDQNPARNKESLATVKKSMRAVFKNISESELDQFTELYLQHIDEADARRAIARLYSEDPLFRLAFCTDDELSVVDEYCHVIEELEANLASVLEDNEAMIAEREEAEQLYSEEVLFSSDHSPAPRRRRSLDTDFDAPDESNRALYEEAPRSHLDPAMAKRQSYLESTAGRTDVVRDKNYLTETWDLQRNKI